MVRAISLDIETLSTKKSAVVVSIGACTISLNEEPRKTFYLRVEAQDQLDRGRKADIDTIKFWMQQDPIVQLETFWGETIAPAAALDVLRAWISNEGDIPVWAKGPAFDGAILESLAETYGVKPAWGHRQHMCVRTIEESIYATQSDELKLRYRELKRLIKLERADHHALDDAIAQAKVVEWWYKELGNVNE